MKEGLEPPPLWWFWLVFSILIISVIYLILFPGLGAYRGLLNWSQDSRLASSYALYHDRFDDLRRDGTNHGFDTLRNNAAMMASADRIFQQHCAGCHGADAKGQANLFPSLVDGEWQWGGTPTEVEKTIRDGRIAAMPSWRAALGEEGVANLATYIKKLNKPGREERLGHVQYVQMCVACHGLDGKGNSQMGAPDLTNLTWLYGHSIENIHASIANGRNGQMPAFGGKLDDMQIRLLTARFSK